MFAGSKKCTRNSTDCPLCLWVQKGAGIGGEGAVFMGSKKCTRNSADCLLCLRVLKNAPAMVLHIVILSVAKDLAGCTNILWFGYLEILHFVQNDSA